MKYLIRPRERNDYAQIAEIINAIETPWQTNVEETRREDDEIERAGGTLRHLVGVDPDSERIVGHGVLRGWRPADQAQQYQMELRVAPSHQNRGIGSDLWRSLRHEIHQLQATSVRSWIRDCYPAALAFARKQGFVELSRNGPWYLDLTDAETSRFSTIPCGAGPAPIVLTTLAEELNAHPECLGPLHRLRLVLDADIPVEEPYPAIGFDDFVREFQGASALQDGIFIVKCGEDYIGMCCLNRDSVDPRTLNQTLTGVLRDYRHQGIALALKARAVDYAKENEYARIVTYVDSTNAPMSSLNRKIGFRPGVAAVLMELRPQAAP